MLVAAISMLALVPGRFDGLNARSCSLARRLRLLSPATVNMILGQPFAFEPTTNGKFRAPAAIDLPGWLSEILGRGSAGLRELLDCTEDKESFKAFVYRDDIKQWSSLQATMDVNTLAIPGLSIVQAQSGRMSDQVKSNALPYFSPTIGDISWALIGIISNREYVTVSSDFLGNGRVSAPSVNALLRNELESYWATKPRQVASRLVTQLKADVLRPDSIFRLQGSVKRLLLYERQLGLETVLKVLQAEDALDRGDEGFYYQIGYRNPLFARIREKVVVLRAVESFDDLRIDTWCRTYVGNYRERAIERQDCYDLVRECLRRLGKRK